MFSFQKNTPEVILPLKKTHLGVQKWRGGGGLSLVQSPDFLWKDFWTFRKLTFPGIKRYLYLAG